MIQMVCDRCGKDCDAIAFKVDLRLIENPSPLHMTHLGRPNIGNVTGVTFMLCQECRKQYDFPNVFTCNRENKLVWKDGGEECR